MGQPLTTSQRTHARFWADSVENRAAWLKGMLRRATDEELLVVVEQIEVSVERLRAVLTKESGDA